MHCEECLNEMMKCYIGTPNDTPLLIQNISTESPNRYSPTFAVVTFPPAIEHFETFAALFLSLPSMLIEKTYVSKFNTIYFKGLKIPYRFVFDEKFCYILALQNK
jgi:hypothetical protein